MSKEVNGLPSRPDVPLVTVCNNLLGSHSRVHEYLSKELYRADTGSCRWPLEAFSLQNAPSLRFDEIVSGNRVGGSKESDCPFW